MRCLQRCILLALAVGAGALPLRAAIVPATISFPPVSVSQAKLQIDYSAVYLVNEPVTHVFSDYFYIADPDRSAGIKVQPVAMPAGLQAGSLVDVTGTVQTDSNSERVIVGGVSIDPGSLTVTPLDISIRALGGGDWFYDAVTGAGQKGATGRIGLNNVGLPVRICGTITQAGLNYYLVTDGGGTAVKVTHPVLFPVPFGQPMATFTGICRLEASGTGVDPVVAVSSLADMTILYQSPLPLSP